MGLMNNAVIIHGMPSKEEYLSDEYPSPSNSHWLPWLQKELLKQGVLAQTPEMPTPYEPKYEQWAKVLEQFEIYDQSVLIGHSLGAGFLVRWLSESRRKVRKLVLVAPWMDPEREFGSSFEMNLSDVRLGDLEIVVLISRDDGESMIWSTQQLVRRWPEMTVHWFEDKGHFTLTSMGSSQFPELLEAILV